METILSLLAMFGSGHFLFVIALATDAVWFSRVCPYFRYLLHKKYIPRLENFPDLPKDANMTGALACMWANCIEIARESMSREIRIYPIKYEDILEKPREVVRRIFENLNIDVDHVEQALSSLTRDRMSERTN